MKVIDFLILYLTEWFEDRQEQLSWSTATERAIYAIGLVSVLWLVSLIEIIDFFITGRHDRGIPMIPGVIVGLLLMALYKYIYVTKGRLENVRSHNKLMSNLSDRKGKTISIVFVLFSFALPFITLAVIAW